MVSRFCSIIRYLYRVATKSQHELSLPTILTDQLNVMKTSYEDENVRTPVFCHML